MQTYSAWGDFCHNRRHDPLVLDPDTITDFLNSQPDTMKTRKRKLTALRQLAKVLWITSGAPEYERAYKLLEILKAPSPGKGTAVQERAKRALTPEQVYRVFGVWNKHTVKHKRNRAIIAVLLLTGMRRSEIAALQWRDVDLENNVIYVRHGKGEKDRDVSIIGSEAHHALRIWHEETPDRFWVFPSLTPDQKIPEEDKPTNGQTIYRVVKHTEKLSGVEFSPHDGRRTFITEALNNGTPVHDVQVHVGHSEPATTLGYAQKVGAKERRKKFKLRYGG